MKPKPKKTVAAAPRETTPSEPAAIESDEVAPVEGDVVMITPEMAVRQFEPKPD